MGFKRYYDNSTLVEFNEGDSALLPTVQNIKPEVGDDFHEVKAGDTLEYISSLFYRDAKLWHIIGQANEILYPFELEPGTVLRIPAQSNEA